MVRDTLNELSQLRNSGFGQPVPRHGLDLLYWFAHDYIDFIHGDIVPTTSPRNGEFGFHMFHNRIEDDNLIVPLQSHAYYEVGNLRAPGANKLPVYVRARLGWEAESNKDRIIVRLDNFDNIERVYITEHSDQKRFDNNKTYRVSQGLLQMIKNTTRLEFLKLITPNVNLQSYVATPPENNSWCTIL